MTPEVQLVLQVWGVITGMWVSIRVVVAVKALLR